MIDTPAWRLDDAAAYDALRDAAISIAGRLAARGDWAAAAALRSDSLRVDGLSRDAGDAFIAELRQRDLDGGSRS